MPQHRLRKAPRATPFGSVWDSQLGTPTSPPASRTLAPLNDDDDLDEPEIPEYLIAEQRRGAGLRSGQGGNRGPRGGRAAYQSAIARERYGPVAESAASTAIPMSVAGQPRREDRSYDRGPRPAPWRRARDQGDRSPAPRRERAEWSEVPPELEAQLRAQLGHQAAPRAAGHPRPRDRRPSAATAAPSSVGRRPTREAPDPTPQGRPRRGDRSAEGARGRRRTAEGAGRSARRASRPRRPAADGGARPTADAEAGRAATKRRRRPPRRRPHGGRRRSRCRRRARRRRPKRRTTRKPRLRLIPSWTAPGRVATDRRSPRSRRWSAGRRRTRSC